ncbi:hypothetical protein LPJ61_001254, partial [Coemansia biformis]
LSKFGTAGGSFPTPVTAGRLAPITTAPPAYDPKECGGRERRDSHFDDVALMLARAEVANDLLFSNPKRVVIEGGSLHADHDTLQSLADVTSPTAVRPPRLSTAMAAASPESNGSSRPELPMQAGAQAAAADDADAHAAVPGEAGATSAQGAPLVAAPGASRDSYKVYPDGDERALPEFILNCKTMAELDAATGAWEAALDELPDGDFWRAVVNDLDGLQQRAPLHLSAKIRAGVPSRVRGVVWQTLTQARSTYLQTVYTQLVKEYSPHERVIRRDLTRTFPRVPVFKSEGGEAQQRLFRILKAYSLYDAEVGYCQGLGFIIGPLIMSMGECEAFCVLVRLMETYDLRGMFTEDMAGLHLRLYQFQELATEIAPDVMRHLEAHGVLPAMYVPSWFLSLFAYTMPLSFVLRAMDVIMAERAPESIVRIGVALLQRNADKIMAQDDFESAMGVLNASLYDEGRARDRPGFVLQEAARLGAVVTAARMEALEVQYYREQGTEPRASQSASADTPPARRWVPTTNHAAAVKFLGWPWGRDATSTAAPSATLAPRRSTDAAGSAAAAGGRGRPGPTTPTTGRASSSGSGSSSSGTISPRVLELTQAQKEYSQQLREQMLWSLQTQADAPATVLGPTAPHDMASEVKQRRQELPDAQPLSPSPLPSSSSSSLQYSPPIPTGVPVHRRCSAVNDVSWQDEVLEPLRRQLHDARVTSETHRDTLAALQVDHEALRAELAVAKIERAGLAEENDQLRMRMRRAEAEAAKTHQAAGDAAEQQRQAETALVRARVELAEAEEERALLAHQLSNLRTFIANTNGSAAAPPPPPPLSMSMLLPDEREDGVVSRAAAADSSESASAQSPRPNRFSISSIASNWSALREAIVSPRQQPRRQLQEQLAPDTEDAPSPRRSSVTVLGATSPVPSSSSSSSSSPPAERASSSTRHSGAIPLAMLHRSKTLAVVPSTTAAAASRRGSADGV